MDDFGACRSLLGGNGALLLKPSLFFFFFLMLQIEFFARGIQVLLDKRDLSLSPTESL